MLLAVKERGFDLGLQVDLRATDARRLGVGMRGAIGIEVAISRIEHGADKMLGFDQRQQVLRFTRCQQRGLEAEVARARAPS